MLHDEVTRAFEAACEGLRAGRLTEAQYARASAPYWRRWAGRLFRRWGRKLPAWVEAADVEQELLSQSLAHVRAWEPGRSPASIGQTVAFWTTKRVQRRLDSWRGASTHGTSGKNASRVEKAFSRVFSPEVDPLARLAAEGETAEEAIGRAEEFAEKLADCRTVREALVLLALRSAGGSPARAAELLYENFGSRIELSLRDADDARRAVAESVSRIAARAEPGDAVWSEDLFGEDEGDGDGEVVVDGDSARGAA